VLSKTDGDDAFGEGPEDASVASAPSDATGAVSGADTAASDGSGVAAAAAAGSSSSGGGGGDAALAVSLQRRLAEMQGVLGAKTTELTQVMERLGAARDRVEGLEGELQVSGVCWGWR
jgi:hypothetical protein